MNIFVDGRMESNAAPVQDEGPTARVIVDGEDESGGGGGGKNAIQGVSVAGTPITPDDNKVSYAERQQATCKLDERVVFSPKKCELLQ